MNSKPTYQELENQIIELKKRNEIFRLQSSIQKEEEGEYYYSNIINNIGDPIFVKDDQSRLLIVNDAFCEIFDLSRANIIGKTLAEDVPSDERESFLKIDKQVITTGVENINEESLTVRGSETRTISTRKTRFIDSDGKKFLVGVIRDITERKKIEHKLIITTERAEESEEIFRVLIENMIDGFYKIDENGNVTLISPSVTKISGFSEEEIIGKPVASFYAHPDERNLFLEKLRKTGKVENYQAEFKRNGKSNVFCEINAQVVYKGGDYNGIEGIFKDITDRKLAEDALKASEEIFNTIADFSNDWEYWTNPQGEFIYISPSCERITGYSPNEFKQSPELLTSIVHPDDLNNWKNHKHDVFDKAEIETIEFRIITKNGEECWIGHVCQTIYNDNGANIGIRGSNRDITENKLVESALQESKQKFESMILNSPDLIMIQNTNGKTEYISPQCEEILGYTAEEIKNIDISKLVHPDDLEKTIKTELTTLGGVELNSFEYRFLKKNGDVVWLDHTARPIIVDGKITEILSTVRDITDRKKAENTLRKSENKLQEAQQIALLGNWELDIQRNILTWSDEIYRMFGLKPQGFKATYEAFLESIHPDDRDLVNEAYSNSLKTKDPYEIEHRLLLKSGIIKYVKEKCKTEFDKSGKPLFSQGVVIDITKEKEVEEILKIANATKDKFFSIIAHDLKSPFNTMLGFSQILNENYDEYSIEQKKKFIGIIYEGLQSTLKLLENLLQWSLSQMGVIAFNPEKINLYLMAKETCDFLNQPAETKSINIINQIVENIYVEADGTMLATIIRNLLSNAIKYTGKSGEITIETFLVPDENNIQYIGISVSDTGVGVPKEIQSKLFDIGENTSMKGTENETGTGLGLILCKEFVEKHGGKIWVESEVDKGSTFYFTIPNK